MYQLLLLFLALFLSTGKPVQKEVVSCAPKVKCYGRTPCNACTSCNYCAYCNSGGTCGVCAKSKAGTSVSVKNSFYEVPATTIQCKAITKKGTRCSRSGTYNGYCWQHKQ